MPYLQSLVSGPPPVWPLSLNPHRRVLRGCEIGADYRWCRSTKSCLHEKDRPSVEIARFPLDARHVTDGGTWPVYVEANGDVKAGSKIEILALPARETNASGHRLRLD